MLIFHFMQISGEMVNKKAQAFQINFILLNYDEERTSQATSKGKIKDVSLTFLVTKLSEIFLGTYSVRCSISSSISRQFLSAFQISLILGSLDKMLQTIFTEDNRRFSHLVSEGRASQESCISFVKGKLYIFYLRMPSAGTEDFVQATTLSQEKSSLLYERVRSNFQSEYVQMTFKHDYLAFLAWMMAHIA